LAEAGLGVVGGDTVPTAPPLGWSDWVKLGETRRGRKAGDVDACFLHCARTLSHPLLTLDARMRQVATELKIPTLDLPQPST
jgi:hypothetical protein